MSESYSAVVYWKCPITTAAASRIRYTQDNCFLQCYSHTEKSSPRLVSSRHSGIDVYGYCKSLRGTKPSLELLLSSAQKTWLSCPLRDLDILGCLRYAGGDFSASTVRQDVKSRRGSRTDARCHALPPSREANANHIEALIYNYTTIQGHVHKP